LEPVPLVPADFVPADLAELVVFVPEPFAPAAALLVLGPAALRERKNE
jgi:hypothetical protein